MRSKILESPWLGILLWFSGVALSVYLYWAGQQHPGLVFYALPSGVVANREALPDLRILFHNRQIRDVSAAQIMLWNQGNESIRTINVLDPVKIVINPNKPILAAIVVKVSRPFIRVTCDDKHLNEGIVPLSWNILEKGDGAVIQLFYEGPPDVVIKVKGTIEQQGELRVVKYPFYSLPIGEQIRSSRKGLWAMVKLLAATAMMIVVLTFSPARNFWLKLIYLIPAGYLLILCAITFLQLLLTAPPPFAF